MPWLSCKHDTPSGRPLLRFAIRGRSFILSAQMAASIPFSSRYILKASIGQGGMGEVYRAWDKVLNRETAVKLLRRDICTNPAARASFVREARAFSILHHSNIIEFYDCGITDTGQLYSSMELIRGLSLHDIRDARLTLSVIKTLFLQILDALDYAHQRNLIHLDIKTENVLVSMNNGQICAKLADFGLAALPLDDSETGFSAYGTPAFMAPEQILHQNNLIGPTTDIYAVGILLFELLTGKLPFNAESSRETLKAHLNQPVPELNWLPQLEGIPTDIKSELTRIVHTAMAKKPWARFICVADIKIAIERIPQVHEEWENDPVLEKLAAMSEDVPETSSEEHVISHEEIKDKVRSIEEAEDSDLFAPSPTYSEPSLLSESLESIEVQNLSYPVQFQNISPPTECLRSNELAFLKSCADNALLGSGTTCIVSGHFGTGKTRLIKTFTQNYLTRQFHLVTCAPVQYHPLSQKKLSPEETAFAIIQRILNQIGSIAPHDGGETLLDRLGRAIISPDKEFFLKLKNTTFEEATSPESAFWMQAIDLIILLLPQATAMRPVAILIDDLQRCSHQIYKLAERLRTLAPRIALLILIAFDDSELASKQDTAKLQPMVQFPALFKNALELRPFSDAAMLQMLRDSWHLDDSLCSKVTQAAAGNPYYATALVQHLSQNSRLQKKSGGLFGLSHNDTEPLGVPAPISLYFKKKISEISILLGSESEFYIEILIRISAFGHHMNMQELEFFWELDDDKALADCWREAIASWNSQGILVMQPDETGVSTEVSFAEPWIIQVVQADLSQKRLRIIKAQAAMALVECYDNPTYTQSWRIAKLWFEAGDSVSYIQNCQQSADRAYEEADLTFAMAQYDNLASVFDCMIQNDTPSKEVASAIGWPDALRLGAETALMLNKNHAFDKYCARLRFWAEHYSYPICIPHIQALNAKRHLRAANLLRAAETAALSSDSYDICNSPLDSARTGLIKADILMQNGDPDNARQNLMAALDVFKTDDSAIDEALAAVRLAQIEWFSGHPNRVLDCLEKSDHILTEDNHSAEARQARFIFEFIRFFIKTDSEAYTALYKRLLDVKSAGDEYLITLDSAMFAVAAVLMLDWDTIHSIPKPTNHLATTSLLTGALTCIHAIELALNGEHFEADNEIAMAIASFGPMRKRERAWCHTLNGMHAAMNSQLKEGALAFDRAQHDFESLDDQIGLTAVLVGQASLAATCHLYDDAFDMAMEAIQNAKEAGLYAFMTLALGPAACAACHLKQPEKLLFCDDDFPSELPELFIRPWLNSMNQTAQLMEQNYHDSPATACILNIIHRVFNHRQNVPPFSQMAEIEINI